MPSDYPKSPPKATFQTRIYHPNVDEKTGVVCLDTLKRDWVPTLTLKDILITISCLLIQPNPDSALNAPAGSLIQEDYDLFTRQAQLMASIHAPIPRSLSAAVWEAKRRGEVDEQESDSHQIAQKTEDDDDDTKENDPARSSDSSTRTFTSSQQHAKGKRPLSELRTPTDLDAVALDEVHSEHESKSPRTEHPDVSDPRRPSGKAASVENVQAMSILDQGEKRHEATHKQSHVSSSFSVPGPALGKNSSVSAARRRQPRVGIRRL